MNGMPTPTKKALPMGALREDSPQRDYRQMSLKMVGAPTPPSATKPISKV